MSLRPPDEAAPAGLRIRTVGSSDPSLTAVAALEARLFPEPWTEEMLERELRRPLSRLLVAERQRRLVGHVLARCAADEGDILSVAVAPDQRRAGIGGALLDALARCVAARGARRLFLEVRASNEAACGLYASRGFHPVGRRAGYYGDGEDAVVWRLVMPGPSTEAGDRTDPGPSA